MKITLNGNESELEEKMTVLQLLNRLGLHPQRVAVERNRSIIKKNVYETQVLQDGDEVEVLQFVGGG